MNVRNLIVIAIIVSTALCSFADDLKSGSTKNTVVSSKATKFNSAWILNGEKSVQIGKFVSKLAVNGTNSEEEPMSPTVAIIRKIEPKDRETTKKMGVKVGFAYHRLSHDKYKLIRKIDLSLSDKELAKQFGVDSEEQ